MFPSFVDYRSSSMSQSVSSAGRAGRRDLRGTTGLAFSMSKRSPSFRSASSDSCSSLRAFNIRASRRRSDCSRNFPFSSFILASYRSFCSVNFSSCFSISLSSISVASHSFRRSSSPTTFSLSPAIYFSYSRRIFSRSSSPCD